MQIIREEEGTLLTQAFYEQELQEGLRGWNTIGTENGYLDL